MLRRRESVFGFSMVELLVAVGVMALLFAILLPSLKKAREQARRVACAAHQRQVVIASETYAQDFGTLPIMNRQGRDINYRYVPALGTYVRQEINGFGPETWPVYLHPKNFWTGSPFRGLLFQVDIFAGMDEHHFGKWRNFGLLFTNKSFSDPKGAFCPSQRNPFYAWDTPFNPWPPRFETARRPDNPNWANHTESSFERRLGLTGIPWDRISPLTALVTDRLLDEDENPRIVSRTHGYGVNAAYRDGHVVFIRDDRFHTWLPADASWETFKEEMLRMYDWLDHQFYR